MNAPITDDVRRRLERHSVEIRATTDWMFARLLLLEWVSLIAMAVWSTPFTWQGDERSIHPHVWLATLLGAVIVAPTLYLIRRAPGSTESRHGVAVAQSMISVLLIHLSGGRIETHFHVFGSLAFLSFYRDWRVLITATIVAGLDHAIRGIFRPESVFGVATSDPWRWLEHVGWVLFEDFFLIYSCRRSIGEMTEIARREIESENSASKMEAVVEQRTAELRESERLLRHSCKEAQSANVAKSEFLANMSHEIRTPMTAILGYADLLFECGDLSRAPIERVEAIETIRRNGNHLLALLNDLLDLSRVESGKLAVERIPFSPANILEDVEHLMRIRADKKRIDFNVRVAGPIPEVVVGDPTRVRQIIVNLVGNAVKFTEQGGVTVDARFTSTPNAMMEIDVTDSGIGMSLEEQRRIFQPFVQADTSVSRRFGGSGLGLIISRRLGELLGGEVILVGSEPGVGTCFRLRLPIEIDTTRSIAGKVVARAPIRATTPAERPLAGVRVLVAEDGPDNQRLILHYLARAGAEAELVENGLEAVASAMKSAAEHRMFDAVLMDMQMPEMDGYTATERLRKLGYEGRIIAVTAHAMSGDRRRCLAAGCDDYITKPIDRNCLIEMLGASNTKAGDSTGSAQAEDKESVAARL